jgi:MerR family redox-sensitive transcriptional activator SoxR
VVLIGEVAARSGVASSAIRYYEELGLIAPAGRESGRRVYGESATNRVRAIAAAREAGFSLHEIRRLLDSQAEGTDTWRALVEAKIGEVQARIARLHAVELTLRDSLGCGCRAWDECSALVGTGGNG